MEIITFGPETANTCMSRSHSPEKSIDGWSKHLQGKGHSLQDSVSLTIVSYDLSDFSEEGYS